MSTCAKCDCAVTVRNGCDWDDEEDLCDDCVRDMLESTQVSLAALLTAARDTVAQRFGSATAEECWTLYRLKQAIRAAEREVRS